MKAVLVTLLALELSSSTAWAQRSPDPTIEQQRRVLACHEHADRDMTKPVAMPAGATRAWEFERAQRVKLCLAKAAEVDEAGDRTLKAMCLEGPAIIDAGRSRNVCSSQPVADAINLYRTDSIICGNSYDSGTARSQGANFSYLLVC